MSKQLTIMQMNDTHGYLELHNELFWKGDHPVCRKAGGYARIASIIQNARDQNRDRVLAFDCGDTIHGTYPCVETEGEIMVPILNKIGFDAMTAHWEFAYGPEQFKKISKQLDYPMLAINCYDRDTGRLVFSPYTIKEINGLKVGIIGIAATIVDKVMPESFSEGVRFTLGNEELPGYVEKLRNEERVDLVVVVSHLGFPQEMKLVQEVPGIDILLSSHTHNRLHEPVQANGTILIQSGCHGSFLGRLDLEIDDGVKNFRHQLITVGEDVEPDREINDMVEKAMEPYRPFLEEKLGKTGTFLHRYAVLESTMDNFLLDSIMDLTGAEMAFSNGWRYGAPIPAGGGIARNDLYNIVPANPHISTAEITGRELWDMMEENLERTFSRDPYRQMGGYVKRCAGINLYFKIENPAGERIQELFVQGKRLDPDKTYSAAYITTQGIPAEYGREKRNLDVRAVEGMESYLSGIDTVKAEIRDTVVAV
ncbi:bifunctional metallophosphatase/5'-nucleotidase [Candidatus Micrarchaeota archaeon]|nr:bifunctional metallophosphatase/5'-nucleotidase [Candidatus Micrarchaeota archaeon]